MKIPKYWSKALVEESFEKGKRLSTSLYGWSNESLAKAREQAELRGRKFLQRLHEHGGQLPPSKQYEYAHNPLREEIKHEMEHEGETMALITRNRYGSLVLNTAQVAFVDIDFPEREPPKPSFGKKLQALFQPKQYALERKKALRNHQARLMDDCLRPLRQWAMNNSQASYRLYRTCAGLRVILTDQLYDPTSKETQELLQSLNADPLYCRLTQNQECFRARLTPKHWRVQGKTIGSPPSSYPWEENQSKAETLYREWEERYNKLSQAYATCTLVEEQGESANEPQIQQVVQLHDEYCLGEGRGLA